MRLRDWEIGNLEFGIRNSQFGMTNSQFEPRGPVYALPWDSLLSLRRSVAPSPL